MKFTKVLMALTASAMLITGCASQKNPATNAVAQAEALLSEIRVDAAQFAPTELHGAEATLAKLKSDLAKEDYKDVIDGVPQFNKDLAALKEVVVAKQTQMVAATHEWQTLSAEVPKQVEAIQVRVDALSGVQAAEGSEQGSVRCREGEPGNDEGDVGRSHRRIPAGRCARGRGQGATGAVESQGSGNAARDDPRLARSGQRVASACVGSVDSFTAPASPCAARHGFPPSCRH